MVSHIRYAFRRHSSSHSGSFFFFEMMPDNVLAQSLGNRLALDIGDEAVLVFASCQFFDGFS